MDNDSATNPAQKTINDLNANPQNPRRISQHDYEALKQSIRKFGDLSGIVFNVRTGRLVGGHMRTEAFKQLGGNSAVVITGRYSKPNAVGTTAIGYVEYNNERYTYREVDWAEDWEMAANIAANRIQGEFDQDLLAEVMYNLDEELRALTGHSEDEINKLLNQVSGEGEEEHGELTDTFIVPPFSILDTKQGYWQTRARTWGDLMGDVSATREGTLGLQSLASDKYGGKSFAASGVSELDPVLCEVVYRWFTPTSTGSIFNPFGGEPVSAFVAAYLGYNYTGTELRQEQIDETNKKIATLGGRQHLVTMVQGDARNCAELVGNHKFDLIFSSPPFYDLEVYSDKPEDLSNQGTYEQFMEGYRQAFAGAVSMLNDDRFVAINVTEIRDKAGIYRNFVGDNVKLFTDLGLHFYNDIIIANAIGTAAIRSARNMATRKVVRVHQNLLVFYKGNPANIKNNFGELAIEMPEEYNDGTPANGDTHIS